MAGSHESNQNIEIATGSKKSKTGKSGHLKSGKSGKVHEHSGQSGQQHEHSKKKGTKRVQFSEEPSSKRQRVEEDDPLVYRDGPLEAVSGQFENAKPYFNNGMFIDLKKIEELGFPHLKVFLQKYMCWLGINNEYNINVLRVFCQSLTAKVKYKTVNKKATVRRVTFTTTVRGRTFNFTWRDINRLLGVTAEEMNEWL